MGYDPFENVRLSMTWWKKQTSTSTEQRANEHLITAGQANNKNRFHQIVCTKLFWPNRFDQIMEAELHNQDENESVQSDSDDDSAAGELQKHFENDLKVKPADKVPFLVNLCFLCISGFSTDVAPHNHKVVKHSKKNHKLATHC